MAELLQSTELLPGSTGLEGLEEFRGQTRYKEIDYYNGLLSLLPRGFIWITKLGPIGDYIQDLLAPASEEIQDVLAPAAEEIQDVLSSGFADGNYFARMWSVFAAELARLDKFVIDLVTESVPGLSTDQGLLKRWEFVAGLPDDCTIEFAETQTEAERQAAVHSKLILEQQTVTKQYLIDYAANFGFEITVEEIDDFENGAILGTIIMGDNNLGGSGVNTTIEITVVSGSGNLDLLKCIFDRIKPAHTVLIWV